MDLFKIVVGSLISITVLFLAVNLLSNNSFGPSFFSNSSCGGNMIFGWIFSIIFWIVIIWIIVWLLRDGRLGTPQHKESALDIAKKRYAKGEITKKEFEEMKKEL